MVTIKDGKGRIIEKQNPDGTKLKTSYNLN
jgi:YD repeat-containing protein